MTEDMIKFIFVDSWGDVRVSIGEIAIEQCLAGNAFAARCFTRNVHS